jgi:hypothetical protein
MVAQSFQSLFDRPGEHARNSFPVKDVSNELPDAFFIVHDQYLAVIVSRFRVHGCHIIKFFAANTMPILKALFFGPVRKGAVTRCNQFCVLLLRYGTEQACPESKRISSVIPR